MQEINIAVGDGRKEQASARGKRCAKESVQATHRGPDQLQQVIFQRLPLRPGEVGLSHATPLSLQPIEVRDTRLGERRELVDALSKIGYSVVRVEVDKIFELAVDDPFYGAVAVLEFDAEDGVAVVEGVERVGDFEL